MRDLAVLDTDSGHPDDRTDKHAVDTGGTPEGGPDRLGLAVVLACGLVIAVVLGLLLVARSTAADGSTDGGAVSGEVAADLQARRDAQSAVRTFVANFNSYSVKNIDGYRDRLRPLLTPTFAQSFDLAIDNIVKSVKVTKLRSSGEVLKTAVSSIDAQNATVLVVADATATSAFGERIRHFRWKVTLLQRDGQWLVDSFRPVE
jgi:hypothetical protein